jgi:hypothetical protein
MARVEKKKILPVADAGNGVTQSSGFITSENTEIAMGFVLRDYIQSLLGLKVFMGSRLPLRAAALLGEANAVRGGIRYSMFEIGGGISEGDYRDGRDHLEGLEALDRALSPDVVLRSLLRGEHVNTRHRRHPKDHARIMRIIRDHVGVPNGREHAERCFNAQNNVEQRKAGLDSAQAAYDARQPVTSELVICFSVRKHFDAEYYEKVIGDAIKSCRGVPSIKKITIKDTVGYLRGPTDEQGRALTLEEGNCFLIAQDITRRIEALWNKQKYGPTEVSLHTHDSGRANDAVVAFIDGVMQTTRRHVKRVSVDSLPGGFGFADPFVFFDRLAQKYSHIKIPHELLAKWKQIENVLRKIAAPFGGVSANKHWTDEQLIQCGCAVGAQGSFYDLYVRSAIDDFMQAHPDLFNGPQAAEMTKRARILIKGIAMRFNEWAVDEARWHSITPGADNMNMIAGSSGRPKSGLLEAMNKQNLIRGLLEEGFDPWKPGAEWWHNYIVGNKLHENIFTPSVVEYAREPVPLKAGMGPTLLGHLQKLFKGENRPPEEIGPQADAFVEKMLALIDIERKKPENKGLEDAVPFWPSKDSIELMYLTRWPRTVSADDKVKLEAEMKHVCLHPEHSYPLHWTIEDRVMKSGNSFDQRFYTAYKKNGAFTFLELLAKDPGEATQLYRMWLDYPERFTRDWGLRRLQRLHEINPAASPLAHIQPRSGNGPWVPQRALKDAEQNGNGPANGRENGHAGSWWTTRSLPRISSAFPRRRTLSVSRPEGSS